MRALLPLTLLLLPLSGAFAQQPLSADDREAAVVRLSELLVENYVFEEVAEETADFLYQQLAEGAYDGLGTPSAFCEALNRDLQEITSDRHLSCRPGTLARHPEGEDTHAPTPEEIRRSAAHNHGFQGVEILPGNIGYLHLRGFASVDPGADTAWAALRFLQHAEVIILDLRQNGGGGPAMVALISSFFLPAKTQLNTLYHRATDTAEESWTLDETPVPRRPEVPLYLLTSRFTFSAAEAFTYNMKVRGRATIVGETTGGGAHAGESHQVGRDVVVFMPALRAINPVTGGNWEGTGVAPDIEVPADEALECALREARNLIAREGG